MTTRRLFVLTVVAVALLFLAIFYRSNRLRSHATGHAPSTNAGGGVRNPGVPRFIASGREPLGRNDRPDSKPASEGITIPALAPKQAGAVISKVVFAVSLGAARESVKAIGGNLWRTIGVEDRGYYLSYAGGIFECAEGYMRRAGLESWSPTGSVRFDVEVVEGKLFFRKARPFAEPDYPYKPDKAFWKCYEGAVTRMAFLCDGCKTGKQILLWQLKSSFHELGVGAGAVELPDPSQDNVLVLLKKEVPP